MDDHDLRERLVKMCEVLGVEPGEAARLLEHAGPAGARAVRRTDTPTVRAYLPTVQGATKPGARRAYGTYWNRLVEAYGDRLLTDVTLTDLEVLRNALPDHDSTRRRSNWRNGYQAQRTAVQAWRKFFALAEGDRLVDENPAAACTMEARKASGRRGLTREEVTALYDVAGSGGNDPELDCLLLRFLLETGARRAGVLALTVARVDPKRQTVLLLEKGNQQRELPVSAVLMSSLLTMAEERGVSMTAKDAPVFRYRNGAPLTRKRFNTLFERLQRDAPFPDAAHVSTHWMRHTALTWIERVGGEAVAAAFAGHVPARNRITGLYTTAPADEVVRAWCAVWDEPHPLVSAVVVAPSSPGQRPQQRRPGRRAPSPGAREKP